MTWREYHEATKHSVESLRRAPHFLDWDNMPDPFRHYEGVPVLDLPAPESPATDGPTFLSQLLFYSAAISASKVVPSSGYRYALRVNPSSGNLHPTEFHFATRGVQGWPDGLYHYRPSSHMAEQRALGDFTMGSSAPVVFILTSIAWREAWKYRDRAYRYCLLDIGHASQALAFSARALGCESVGVSCFDDDAVARLWRFHPDEWPMLILELRGAAISVRAPKASSTVWYGGEANELSSERVDYPRIDAIHQATKSGRAPELPLAASVMPSFGEIARRRRSALDFVGGSRSISRSALSALLDAGAGSRFVRLYLYVHRVDGLEPGVYRPGAELELIKGGDQRVAAAGLSLGQELAGNACVAFSMIGDLERGYRYVHFEAGAVGHRLYLAAEALGLGATGIGAFYDERVHEYLGLTREEGQVVYHFAIGYPVVDARVEAR